MKYKALSFLLIISIVLSICPVCYADGSGCFDVASVNSVGAVTLSQPVCTECNVVFSGVHSGGTGKIITLKITDDANGTIYAMEETQSKANGAFSFTFGLKSEAQGKNLTAYINGNDKEGQSTISFVYNCRYTANRQILKEKIREIELLLAECEDRNISAEYEKVNLSVIKRFESFLDSYIEKNLAEEYNHNYTVISSLADETIILLTGYLDGTIDEKVAPIYVSSEISQDGQSLIATVDVKGQKLTQPVFFNGYGHWADALSDYTTFTDLGVNYTHYELGPSSVLKPGTEGRKYDINESAVANVKNIFKTAEDNNLSIMFMTAMHYFPQFIYDNYPEINNSGSGTFPDFMPYNPTHDEVKAALEAFLRVVIPEIKDYKSFHSVCLANEPFFISYEYPDFYIGEYREFLKNKYSTISNLRNAHGKYYYSFDSVTMPETPKVGAQYNDWREFNDSILTEWFAFLKDVVKDIDETIPVHTKCSAYISSGGNGNRRIFCGTNYEQWSPIMDINGCDAWGIYGENANKLQGKTMWYDFMTSMKNAPVINSEDHILRDSTEITYNANELAMNIADMWQGAIHGRAGSVYWLWDKSSRAQNGTYYYNSNLAYRADHVAAIGKVNLDLNRMANEITAIQKKSARCAVMYSNYTQVGLSSLHLSAMYEVYRYLQNNGEKVYIVNDTYPEKLNENTDLELLIVPVCQYMPEKVWTEINEFIENGKKVIFVEYNNDYYNENGKSLDTTLKNNVLNNSGRVSFGSFNSSTVTLSGYEDVHNAIGSAIAGFDRVVSVTSSNGETEWTSAKYTDDYVINLCNYGGSDADISILLDGLAYDETVYDLTENKNISNSFTLKPYETKLVKLKNAVSTMSFRYSDGTRATEIKTDNITSKVNAVLEPFSEYVHLLAIYSSDKTLETVVKTSGTADKNGKVTSSLGFEIKQNKPLPYMMKSFLINSVDNLKPYMASQSLGK
ncbi:MAG: beta-galactosidase [Clostridia bacterium]|nr:beta-galactosidase [Clostridia bacterium]